MEERDLTQATQWDERYSESERIWSGRVNDALADVAAELRPGTALDLGAGEGADVIWLAQHGWKATGIDISAVAVERAQQAVSDSGLTPDQAHFIAADILEWQPDETFDLVNSAFMHSQGSFDRHAALGIAQRLVAPGGFLLVISHATFPPWAKARHEEQHGEDHEHDETTPESELALLALADDQWVVERAELRTRVATGPEGEQAPLDDTVVLARRVL